MGLTPNVYTAFTHFLIQEEQSPAQHKTHSINTLPQINPFKFLQSSATEKKISVQRTGDILQKLYWLRYTQNLNSMFVLKSPKKYLWVSNEEKLMLQKVRFLRSVILSLIRIFFLQQMLNFHLLKTALSSLALFLPQLLLWRWNAK